MTNKNFCPDHSKYLNCLNRVFIRILDTGKVVKGLNVIVLDETKKAVIDIKNFDFSTSGKFREQFLIEDKVKIITRLASNY